MHFLAHDLTIGELESNANSKASTTWKSSRNLLKHNSTNMIRRQQRYSLTTPSSDSKLMVWATLRDTKLAVYYKDKQWSKVSISMTLSHLVLALKLSDSSSPSQSNEDGLFVMQMFLTLIFTVKLNLSYSLVYHKVGTNLLIVILEKMVIWSFSTRPSMVRHTLADNGIR